MWEAVVTVPAGVTPTEACLAGFVLGLLTCAVALKWREALAWLIEQAKEINR